jgi:thiol-disulfide isomerase/thioredoxin
MLTPDKSEVINHDRRRFLGTAAVGVAVAGTISFFHAGMALAEESSGIRPFRVRFPEESLLDLRRRINSTRWSDKETVDDGSQGVQLAALQTLVRHWGTDYNWRKAEARLNALPQFMTTIDGVDIHFIHVRSQHANAMPLIMTHGWPGSVFELLKTVGPLTDPTAHGGNANDAFHVVLPSIPGFGFSEKLASLQRADEWLNSPPLTPSALRGKVVLVDFWTYTCINWIRTAPYVRAWGEKYKDQGLVVIGVHAPEFQFEKSIDNVRRAVKEMRIDYPVAVDNEHKIWRAFDNSYWPALYFIDAQGRVRHHHFGEGEYEQSEKFIQKLLAEAGAGLDSNPISVEARGIEAAADWGSLQSGENYVGYERTQNFASPGGLITNQQRTYSAPVRLRLNEWALSGDWTARSDAEALNSPNGGIAYRFQARDLHLVMGPAVPGTPVRFRVLIDGRPPGEAHGLDVDENGNGTVTEQRLYQLIRQPKAVIDRQFEIEFLDAGVEAFAFTFG